MTDYLVVGQGVAGTLLSHRLMKAGKSVHVVDNRHEGAASAVAAGLINPVTGKLVVKSWRIDELLPAARQLYRELEKHLGIAILNERPIIRQFLKVKEENQWQLRLSMEEYDAYIQQAPKLDEFKSILKLEGLCGAILGGGNAHLGRLIAAFRDLLLQKDALSQEKFDFEKLTIEKDQIAYGGISAKKIIFCEGAEGRFNPLFDFLPFDLVKGEALLIKIPELELPYIFKSGRLFLVNIEKDVYWVGSTYQWDKLDNQPTEAKKEELLTQLNEFLKIPYELLEHRAAIRPAVKDRRPLLGPHPEYPNVFIFNGLGTKGASLAPFWSKHLVEHLEEGKKIDSEVEVKRFEK
jgi:glycine oxidase